MEAHNFLFSAVMFSSALCLVPFITAIFTFKNFKTYLKPIFLLIVISVVIEIINVIFANLGQSNSFIVHYFTVCEFALISLFYSLFFKNYFKPLLINILIPFFLIAAYVDYRIYGLYSNYNFSPSVESIVLIFYSLFFFYYVLKNLIFENLLSTPFFWINTAILFYFSGNMILFVFSNHMANSDPYKCKILWAIIHTFFNILYNVLLSIGFWKTKVR